MINYKQNYNLNSIYVCMILIFYNIYNSNYNYINRIINQIFLFNYMSVFIIINIIGLFLLLKNLSFEIKISCSVKYKKN